MEIAKLLRNVPVTEAKLTHEHITGITSDTRRVQGGELLVCIRGLHHDGHRYSAEGVQKGAAVVLAETKEGLPEDADYILTPDTRLAEALIWNNRYDRPAEGMRKIGITGTGGKTSTAYLLRDLLKAGGFHPGMLTTIRTMADTEEISIPAGGSSVADAAGAMTTPDPEYFYGAIARMREKGCDTLVYEASSHALALHKTDAICPDTALFTNLSPEHMDYHGSMDAYLGAKSRLFAMAQTGIVNADDPWAGRLMETAPDCRYITCTANPEKFVQCDTAVMRYVSHGTEGISFLYCGKDAIFRIRTPLVGRYSMYNAMLAVCCALHMGVDPLTVRAAMYAVSPPEGRMQKVDLAKSVPFSVYIDYAHTPASLEQVLLAAGELHPDKLTVVFGCGGDRDAEKRPLMGEIAGRYAHKVILTDDNPRNEDPGKILDDILAGMEKTPPAAVIPDRREAIRLAIREAEPGELILLCGKGHETYEIRGGARIPFDEAAAVREAVTRRF
ncbi:MAG: UDP-N-acetylmuramoyl-L-alanyl-D-glutamate--2,6-diaminopimelate ligase [Clostridia bacterium]|nr:UDP-N-acetylmuramoyl-L-alanyl-D-glutamate--2,6-diaminopimelate ligase [Clostridia bacterium]